MTDDELTRRVTEDPIAVVREIERKDRHYRRRTAALLLVVAILSGTSIASLVVALTGRTLLTEGRDRSSRSDCIREYTNDSLQILDDFVAGLLTPAAERDPAETAAFARRLDRNVRDLEDVDDGDLCPPD